MDESLRRPPHYYEQGLTYFITTNTLDWLPIFAHDANKRILLEDFKFYRAKFKYKLFLYAIMPDHFHWVIQPSPEDYETFKKDQIENKKKYRADPPRYYLSKIMEDLERHCAFAINKRESKTGRAVWQEGFWTRPVLNEQVFNQIADYLHHNPIKAGLVSSPDEYRFSSHRNIHLGDNRLIALDMFE